jgi:hypothetical protein
MMNTDSHREPPVTIVAPDIDDNAARTVRSRRLEVNR